MKNGLIGLIAGAVVAFMACYYQACNHQERDEVSAKSKWYQATRSIDLFAENVIVWANNNARLPNDITLLKLPPECSGAMYFRSLEAGHQQAFAAYPSLRTPGTRDGPIFAFVEIIQYKNQDASMSFISNGTRAAKVREFQQMLAGKKWIIEVVF